MVQKKLIGPFTQLLTMNNLPVRGALSDDDLEIIHQAGILVENGYIVDVGSFDSLAENTRKANILIEEQNTSSIALPGFIDPHTHICWAGSRAMDYSMRLNGKTYLDIAAQGGGIWSTVMKTREIGQEDLVKITAEHANHLLKNGVTTIEIKSGYGLNASYELKMFRTIRDAGLYTNADLIPTCLAAHICPRDFNGTSEQYLQYILDELLPEVKKNELAKRVDIYIDQSAFNPEEAFKYLQVAKQMGFSLTVHADQFSVGGSAVAVELNALSADHLENSGAKEIEMLAKSNTIPVALPASSIGLGNPFIPARKLLDSGASLAIGSDWNPGSAPMGDLLTSAAILSIYEKINNAETFAAITYRAAYALGLYDRGIIKPGNIADFITFETSNYNEILYNQGSLKPSQVWKKGNIVL